jgi:hypothetical protein
MTPTVLHLFNFFYLVLSVAVAIRRLEKSL